MLQDRQIDRMVQKVVRLEKAYGELFVEEIIEQNVTVLKNGREVPVKEGYKWGSDFKLETFSFVARGIEAGKVYCLFADSGAAEHLVLVNGKKVGMLDFITNAFEPPARIHRYLLLEGLKNGDTVTLEAYFSHTISGLNPHDEPFTWAYDSLIKDRPYQRIALAVINQPLKTLYERLVLLNRHYTSSDRFERAQAEKVYLELFKLLPMEKRVPSHNQIVSATEIIDGYFESDKKLPYVGIIGHSHLDTAWLWTVEETRRKLMRTVSNAVTLLKRHPEYKFFMSTVLYLDWIEKDDPQLFEEIKQLVAEGRFEVNGAAWVECDGNLTGSEAFCRQFLRGKRYLREKFNFESDVFWLPDTFGYSAALPQIMKKSGVDYFLTTKLSWNDTNTFPYETFNWKGIDGSEVPVHFNTIHTWVDEAAVSKRLDDIRNMRETDSFLMAYGFGDGGGGPADEMVTRAIYTEKNCKNVKVEHTTVSDFMKKLSKQELPAYFGELYLELHRGTYTTNHDIKMYNRRLEEAMHDAELISVMRNDRASKGVTDSLYDTLLLNQFHDILPGTCIPEATDVALREQKDALKKARAYVSGVGRKSYFNTLSVPRVEILPSLSGQTYCSVSGERTVAPYEFKGFSFGKKLKSGNKAPFEIEGNSIKTPYLIAELNGGVLTSLVYCGRELIKNGFNVIKAYEDVPCIYDNWDIDADYTMKEKSVRYISQELISLGEYLAVFRVKHEIAEGSVLETDIKFRYDSPMIEFENRLVAADKHTLIRADFDTSLFAPTYKCETQFGYVERNCFDRDKSDIAKFEVCSHKWTDLSEYAMGISLLSDCKYGVSCHGGKMGITLHKSGTHPDPRGDLGESYFRYAILPHGGSLDMDTVNSAYCFNYEPIKTADKDLNLPFEFINSGSVVLETVKHGEDDGIIIRMYEALGATASATLVVKSNQQIIECNLLEDELDVIGEGSARVSFSPFEIKTVKIK